jgi:uncharacterized membrane protein YgcG
MRAYLWAFLIIAAAIAPAFFSRDYRDALEATKTSIVEMVREVQPIELYNLAARYLREAARR